MFARYVVFVLVALAECAALGAPRFRMVLDLEGAYRKSLTASNLPQPSDRYFGFEEVAMSNGAGSYSAPYYFNGSEKVWVGLSGAGYTSANGRTAIELTSFNSAGQATGYSNRYADGQWRALHAWYFDGARTLRIGLGSNSDDLSNDSLSEWPVLPIGPLGHVVGTIFMSSQARIHERAWIFDGNRTREIGLLGADYRGPFNETSNGSWKLTAQGHVYGGAARFNGQTEAQGNSLWYDDGTSTTAIGLTGPGYESSSGTRRANYVGIMNTGYAIGSATRFRGEEEIGNTLWYFNGFSTVPIGLRDSEHTRSDGYQSGSGVKQSSNELFFAGVSSRHVGGDQNRGNTPWLFDGLNSIPIGLIDAYRNHEIAFVSNTGFVAGYANSLTSDTTNERDAWLYNPKRNETISIPIPRQEGKDNRFLISALSDEGIILGVFRDHAFDSDRRNYRPFLFSPNDGFVELSELVTGGDILTNSLPYKLVLSNQGIVHSDDEYSFWGMAPGGVGNIVLIPIPEPSTLALAALALAMLFQRSRRVMR